MIAKRFGLAAAAVAAIASCPAFAVGLSVAKVQTCEALQAKCLARVEKETQNAKKHGTSAPPASITSGACYSAYDQAKSSGVWPQMGPFLPQHCSN